MSNFIDKKEIAKEVFIKQNNKGVFEVDSNLDKYLNEKENVQIILENFEYEISFLTNDELYKKYPYFLPDNENGSLVLFYDLPDLHRDMYYECDNMNIALEKERLERNNIRSKEMIELYS